MVLSQGSLFFLSKILGYHQVLSSSKKPFSQLYCEQKADAKGVLKSQEYKTWKYLSQYNIEMLYILTFQVFC